MAGSMVVVLVPDAQLRDQLRALAASQPLDGVHASIYVADELVEACVRDTRRALFDGALAVLTRDEASSLRALAAGADEACSLASCALDADLWTRLVGRARVRSELRREARERLAAVSELEQLCALGRLAAGLAEALIDPVSSTRLALELLERELDPLCASMARLQSLGAAQPPASDLSTVRAALQRAAGVPARARAVLGEVTASCEALAQVARDLGLGGDGCERYEAIDVRALLDRMLGVFERAAAKPLSIERDYDAAPAEVFVPRARLAQVLISLCANALSSLRGAAQDVRRLRVGVHADAALITVTISDNGAGLAPELLAHIFDPNAARAAELGRGGAGLELTVARSTLRALGGDLTVESLRSEGTTFVAWLPCAKHRELEQREARTPHAALPRRCVLVFEPDRHVLGALSQLLRQRYEVMIAARGDEARRLLTVGAKPDAILVASDDGEGHQFVEWLLLERPDLSRRLLLTTTHAEPGETLGGLPYLEKPLDPTRLYGALEERCSAPLRKTRPLPTRDAQAALRG